MSSTKPAPGTVLNPESAYKKTQPVKSGVTLAIGLVKHTSTGWDNAGTSEGDGSILYWNDKVIDNTNNDKFATCFKKGAQVVGKSDGAIVADQLVRAGTAVAQAFKAHPKPANATTPTGAEVDAVRDWDLAKVAIYKGHALEVIGIDTTATDSTDLQTDCVFEMI